MIYLSLSLNIILIGLLVAQHVAHFRRLDHERSTSASREISLLNRIQAPEAAVVQTLPEPQEQPPIDDSPYADQAWQEYLERTN